MASGGAAATRVVAQEQQAQQSLTGISGALGG
jgi:hypothetical protein